MRNITKKDALATIFSCASAYEQNLVRKNLIFVTTTKDNNKVSFFETTFLPSNFRHLTGVDTKIDSLDFYDLALKRRLKAEDFDFMTDGTTKMKLSVLQSLMNIHVTARMAGDFDFSKSLLITDKLAGTVTAAMGFRKIRGTYVPNTALNTDLRLVTKKPIQRIAVIFTKEEAVEKYNTLTYIAKGITVDDDILQPVLQAKVDIQNLTAAFPIPRKIAEEPEVGRQVEQNQTSKKKTILETLEDNKKRIAEKDAKSQNRTHKKKEIYRD